MSSTKADSERPVREMFRISLSNTEIALKHDASRSLDVCRMTETPCCDSKRCKNGISNNLPAEKHILNRIENESCDTAECSASIDYSSGIHSPDHCTSSEDVNRFTCNCDLMHCHKQKQISNSYACSDAYNSRRTRADRNLMVPTTKRVGTQWRNCFWRTFLIPIIVLSCTLLCSADPNECAHGLKTPGRTWPQGDIVLEYGQSLKILCILNKTLPGRNASDLVFFRNNKEMEPQFITIINETTISLDVEQPPPAEDMYYCKLRPQNDSNKKAAEAICLNKVVVGYKPKEPKNFTCVSHNWENITCSWDPAQNYVTTRFTLVFKLPGRAGRKLYPCPQEKPKDLPPNTCMWDTSTNPIYRQPYEYYTFILNVENVLGNTSFTYKFHHFAHVIPAKPANLSVINKTSDSALLHWSVPFPMQNFPPGLHHRIMYQDHWHLKDAWQVINITNEVHMDKRNYNLSGLEYANTAYDVRVSMKSALATGEHNKWSEFSVVTFRTSPTVPGRSPKTDIGSFEVAGENSLTRDVYLYWQTIPDNMKNGDNFAYKIDHVEENGKRLSLRPNETTETYVKFNGINLNNYYRFEIVSTNIVGMNKERAKIFVPSHYEIPHGPIAFTKIAFHGGLYELSWKPPTMSTEITNYTIFWCDNDNRDRPYQCNGYLDWVHVSKNTTIFNMTVPDPSKLYQFAISTNTHKGSSGMVWASCTVIHDKIVGKMKSVWINRIASDYIEVGWKLDCSDRIGIVEGFNIYYCPIVSPYNLNCKGPKLNTTIRADPHTIHGIVTNLKPYTTYRLSVAVLTKNKEGLHSDPLYNTTLEAAPTTPPQDVKVTNVTNTTMFITWKPPDAMNGVLRYYEVYYNSKAQKVEEANHIELKNLMVHTNYSIGVAACTVSCSVRSPTIYKVTKIGVPGKIDVPNVRFINSSQVAVKWKKPDIAAGYLNYYQISTRNGDIQNSTKTEAQLPIPDCKTVGREQLYEFRVRAVNIASDNRHLPGEWSDPGEGNCYSDGPSFSVWVMIWVIGGVSVIAVLLCVAHVSKRMWMKCKAMQDVGVKLPPGLAPNMLLQKGGEQHIRQSSADSSGCSSGQESVTSSLTSDSQVSSDSGTEIDPMPVSPNKLMETLQPWESSSLRQRNVGVTRPGFTAETARWEPYVKVAKTGEPIIGDSLSLARSTPNLTDSTGLTTSQHTWSSTGYISMPSSEELSSNPSPVPKETTTGGYSVIGAAPKPMKSKPDDDSNITEATAKTLIPIKAETKPPNAYITLASLEQKQKDKKPMDTLRDLDDLAFTESKAKLEALTPFSTAEKSSKPYVKTGLIDSLKKPFALSSIDNTRSTTIAAPFASTSLTDACAKPFVSSFASPPSLPSTMDPPSKPYVSVSSISEMSKKPSYLPTSPEASPKADPPDSSTTDGSKPYVLASSVFQRLQPQQIGKPEATETTEDKGEEDTTAYAHYWPAGAHPAGKLDVDKPIITSKPNTGYVTIAENPKLEQHRTSSVSSPYVQHERFEKPLPQTTAGQSDEQYSKVTVVPSTIQ
ncbi:cytokine receptor domeless isoform X2 [Lasioglossum baleicum]|uniref:cytokine receptor domeless isoform X2 n=1 Tax=Lasioglossum baleicum TaxID=434251 RepID=UPI003FCE69F5